MSHPVPSPEQQLRFLQQIQLLLSEGSYVATYKYALLHAIADLCVKRGVEGSGAPLTLSTEDLARQFVELYERQARPFPAGPRTGVLKQNTGRQARIVTVVAERLERYGGERLARVGDRALLREVDTVIRKMPLWKLQTVGGDRLDFLYPNEEDYSAREISLRTGVAYCFREFHRLVVSLVRDRWELTVRRWNQDVLGQKTDLHEFLFGSERTDLKVLRPVLYDLQDGRCFYTGRPLADAYDVDHFVPWALHPSDLGHNLVLALKSANAAKTNHLASEEHLGRWLDFCTRNRLELASRFDSRKLSHSLTSSLKVAEWSYASTERAGGKVWVGKKELRPLSSGWPRLFESAWATLGAT